MKAAKMLSAATGENDVDIILKNSKKSPTAQQQEGVHIAASVLLHLASSQSRRIPEIKSFYNLANIRGP